MPMARLGMTARQAEKAEMRKHIRGALAALPAALIATESALACERVLAHPAIAASQSVSVYLTMPQGECQTSVLVEELFRRGKHIYVPRIDGKGAHQMSMVRMDSLEQLLALERNSWGIPEPKPLAHGASAGPEERGELVDVVVVPAVAFDSGCNRLGHGRGYYDAFLARLALQRSAALLPPATTIGLGLQKQLVPAVPVSDHDVTLDCVCLPEGPLPPSTT
jgi:5-formyltetrahydrofolate cyclo-ligase